MTENQVRELVKIAYDKAALEGKCGFGIDELDGWRIEVRKGLVGIRFITLWFPGGYLTLTDNSFPRSVMIDIFAEFIWNWNKEK